MLESLLIPARTNYDLHFSLCGVPIRIHPLFWLTTVLLGVQSLKAGPLYLVLWVTAVFISILVHELGHAWMIHRCGFSPRVILHGMGGVATYDPSERLGYDPYLVFGAQSSLGGSRLENILIALAGPVAGFILGAAILSAVKLCGGTIDVEFSPERLVGWRLTGIDSPPLAAWIDYFLQISIAWGLVNLLPIFPLDGGRIARELLESRFDSTGIKHAQLLGTIVAVAMALWALVFWNADNKLFGLLFFGVLAFQNYLIYRQLSRFGSDLGSGGGGFRPRTPREPWERDDDYWR